MQDQVLALLGVIGQLWRAQPKLPNWGLYPLLLAAACLAELAWGPKQVVLQPFLQHVLFSFLSAVGANRVTSDLAKGTVLETKY